MKRSVCAMFLLLLSLGCGRAPNSTSSPDSVIDADAPRWPNPRMIPICFVNRGAVDAELYDDLLNTAVREFGRAGIGFQKWRICTSEDFRNRVIRVKFKDVYNWNTYGTYYYGGGLSKVGASRQSLENENGATMWIKLDRSYPAQPGKKREIVRAGTRSAFLHEIGHALGLLHEHTRVDYRPDSGECHAGASQSNVPESPNRVYVGDPDYDSVMSYCNLTIEKLSDGDIAGIHALYPELY